MISIGELTKNTGLSARTLHYYDEIGLLKPSGTTEAGYRLYDEAATERLANILFYRELGFSLKDIARLIDDPRFDKAEALRRHRRLLIEKRDRIDALIRLTEKTTLEAEDMKAFDETGIRETERKYAAEAEQKWGMTSAYQEYEARTKGQTDIERQSAKDEMDALVRAFGEAMDGDPASEQAQTLVARWQKHITDNYYTCTKPILMGLGEMYVGDERFTANLDRYRDGTARFMSEAIRIYTM